MVSYNLISILVAFALASNNCAAFVTNKYIASPFFPNAQLSSIRVLSSTIPLSVKKKKGGKTNKGFAKSSPTTSKSSENVESASTSTTTTTSSSSSSSNSFSLESIEDTTSPALNSKLNKPIDIDPSLSAEERAEQILRQRFNMKSYEEEQGDIVAQQKRAEAKARADKLKKLAAIDDGSFDIFAVLPTSLVKFIDGFLKLGLTVSTILFVAAGIGICFEAYATATGNALPEDMDQFIVNVIEPNFTPGK